MRWFKFLFGRMVKRVDTQGREPCTLRCVGSNPSSATERNYMDDVTTLREKLKSAGWSVREFPVRSNDIVKSWKLVAAKGQKSITIGGETLDGALLNLAKAVGVVSRTAVL